MKSKFFSQVTRMSNRHFFALDILIFFTVPLFALILRTDAILTAPIYGRAILIYMLFALALRLIINHQMGIYAIYWRYASIDELILIGKSTLFATIGLILFSTVASRLQNQNLYFLPRSLPIIEGLLVFFTVGATRLSSRYIEKLKQIPTSQPKDKQNVLIYGAGQTGLLVAKELLKSVDTPLKPIGFLDDDVSKHNIQLHSMPILGGLKKLKVAISTNDISYVIIAMPSATGKTVRNIVRLCEELKVETKTVPAMYELLDGSLTVNQLRDVNIEDLLRRDPVQTDIAAVSGLVTGKRVLVTGGGGSIGSELCRQLLRFRPAELLILDHGENPIFEIMQELKRMKIESSVITSIVADIRHADRIKHVFDSHRPQLVFHAAAHKHVRFMEWHPTEAVTNNVLGTRNILNASLAYDVERFVMISTDKAVNPTSVMGVSKRAAELLVHQAAAESGRPYVAVRFGNVLGSRGSVVLTFKQQIANGGPITITHPDMKRFFMTIPEAVQLVLQAAVLGHGNEVYVLDMGKPIKIIDLARDMIELSGLKIGQDIDIEFIGKLPGEKLFEELFIPGEEYHRTQHHKVFIAGNASSFAPHDLADAIDALINSAQRGDKQAILLGFKSLVPEFDHAVPSMGNKREKVTESRLPLLTAVSPPEPVHIQ